MPHRRKSPLPALGAALAMVSAAPTAATTAPLKAPPGFDIPQSRDPMWTLMRKTLVKADYTQGVFVASFPPEVRAVAGHDMTITGYMLPIDTDTRFDHFILSRYSPSCPFCPPGEPNEHIEIFTARPVALTINLVTVHGRFGLQNDQSQGLFLRLDKAIIK